MQKYRADSFTIEPNGAKVWRSMPSGCLAKVENCLIENLPFDDVEIRKAAYITGEADTFFSVPAKVKIHGVIYSGYVTGSDSSLVFRLLDSSKLKLSQKVKVYDCEYTDTFSGELNYSFVTRFKVAAETIQQAARIAGAKIGIKYRANYVQSFEARYDSKSGATAFVLTECE